MQKPKCKLTGTDGNVFALMGRVSAALRKARQEIQIPKMREEVMSAKSYDEALQIMMKYVDVR